MELADTATNAADALLGLGRALSTLCRSRAVLFAFCRLPQSKLLLRLNVARAPLARCAAHTLPHRRWHAPELARLEFCGAPPLCLGIVSRELQYSCKRLVARCRELALARIVNARCK